MLMIFRMIRHVLLYDIWFYISHRFLHCRCLYWMHKIHHEKKNRISGMPITVMSSNRSFRV